MFDGRRAVGCGEAVALQRYRECPEQVLDGPLPPSWLSAPNNGRLVSFG